MGPRGRARRGGGSGAGGPGPRRGAARCAPGPLGRPRPVTRPDHRGPAGEATGLAGGAGLAAGHGPLAADAAPLALAHPAPDAELLAVGQGVLEALGPHHAALADLLGLPRGG